MKLGHMRITGLSLVRLWKEIDNRN